MRIGDVWLASLTLRAEEVDEDIRRITGIASTGDAVRDGFRIEPKSMERVAKTAAKRKLKVFWNHGWSIPIGKVETLAFDRGKLHVSALIGRGFPVPVKVDTFGGAVLMSVDDLWNIIQQDLATSFSIAFNADEELGAMDETGKRQVGTLTMRDLFEVTVATIPVDPGAEFTVKRAMDDELFVRAHGVNAPKSRAEVWGYRVDGSAAAAAVGGETVPEMDDRDPVDLVRGVEDDGSDIDWDEVREVVEACRRQLSSK